MRKATLPWLFCLPAIVALLAVAGYPLARTAWFSFTDARLFTIEDANWVGLQNYRYLVRDPHWWRSVWNTLIFTTFTVGLETIFGLAIAVLLNTRIAYRGALRAAVLVPWAIPAVVSAKMWAWMFNDMVGVINELLLRVGLIGERLPWLADDTLSFTAIILVDVWKTTPFMALLILAGLQGIPASLYEAARLEGASAFRQFRAITLPLLRPTLIVAVLFRTLDALRVFDLPFVLSSNSRSTAVMSVYARQHLIDFQDIGYGSAASFLVFGVVAFVSVLYLSFGRRSI